MEITHYLASSVEALPSNIVWKSQYLNLIKLKGLPEWESLYSLTISNLSSFSKMEMTDCDKTKDLRRNSNCIRE
jgi:hypothetical protein